MRPLLLLLTHSALALALAGTGVAGTLRAKDPAPPDHSPPLEKNCGEDLRRLCPGVSKVLELYCLYENKDTVSDQCASYLGSTTIGACNDAAMTYCGEFESVPDITTCLFKHNESLSEECLINLESANRVSNPMVEEQREYARATAASALIVFVFISIPLLALGWAIIMWYRLYLEDQKLRSASSDYLKAHSEALELVRACDGLPASPTDNHSWSLSFHALRYWAESNNGWPLLNKLSAEASRPILSGISGECPSQAVTAVMGPSGSGKTTLLKLLGGQTYNGRYSGFRAINGNVLPKDQYDEIMRRQGFVAQGDHLMATLTVWQTLMFASLLRLPEEMSVHRKLCRAAHIMSDLGLSSVAHVPVGGADGGGGGGGQISSASAKGISGGQRRRLSIAQELLANPSTLLLDEPTSGLDAASTLQIVQTLHQMTRRYKTTVVLTIHQPRAEVFELFDSLILMASGGHLVYCGDCAKAISVLSTAPCVQAVNLAFTNPGDFIIDILGLSAGPIEDSSAPVSTINPMSSMDSSTHELLNQDGAVSTSELDEGIASQAHQLCAYFESTSQFSDMLTRLEIIVQEWHAVQREECEGEGFEMQQLRSTTSSDSEDSSPSRGVRAGIRSPPAHHSRAVWSAETSLQSRLQWRLERAPYPASFLTQIYVLSARRTWSTWPSLREFTGFVLQISSVCCVVAFTFSYEVSSEMEAPYQVLMLLSIVSLYLMIIQYLQLIPEYMRERQVIWSEMGAKYVRSSAYLLSTVVTEIPVAVAQTLLLFGILYSAHPLNPDTANVLYTLACTMLGLAAWQSMIGLCAVSTDVTAVAYSVLFLVLGSGTLFGGLLVRYSKLPAALHPFYYISVAAVTQRALISNDLRCCYLTVTCNSIKHDLLAQSSSQYGSHTASTNSLVAESVASGAQSMMGELNWSAYAGAATNVSSSSTTFCPPGLEFTGDGSDLGNLGRVYLLAMDLQKEHPLASVAFLLIAAILFRAAAMLVLGTRQSYKDGLREVR